MTSLENQIAALEAQLSKLKSKKETATIVKDTLDFFINEYGITPELKTVDFKNSSEKQYIIDGNIQSGKTKTLISFAVTSLTHHQKVVIVVRNFKEDCIQLVNSINSISARHNTYLQNTSGVKFEYSACSINDIYKWMYEKNHNILVLMANTTQLSTLAKMTVDNKFTDYTLFIDEADALMNTIQTHKEVSVFNMMHIVYTQSKIAFLISATSYANLFKDGTSPSRFIKVKQHENYQGIENIEFEILPPFQKQKTKGSVFDKSPGLYNVLRTLSHRPVYSNHPTILLTKCTHLVAHQTEFIQTIATSKDWSQRWAAIGYNGVGITMYHSSFEKLEILEISKVKGVKIGTGTFTFKGLGIMKAMSYLRENGGKTVFPRIVVISGHLASRCINFMDNAYQWHLTDEYLDASTSMNSTDLIQSLRICGIHDIVTPLKVWCNEEIMKNIVRTHFNLGGFIQKLVDYKKDSNVEFKTILESVKFHKNKLGNRKVCKIKAPYKKVSNEKQDNTWTMLGGVEEKDVEDNYTEKFEIIKNAFENKTGIIYNIINMFINNEFKSLTKKELDICSEKNNINLNNYTQWNDHGRYLLIEETCQSSGKYNLSTKVIEYLKLV
jgi:hypothetical protein